MNKSVAKLSGEPLVTCLTTKERRVVDEDCEEVNRVDRELDRLFKEFWHGSEHDMASARSRTRQQKLAPEKSNP